MSHALIDDIHHQLAALEAEGLSKHEREIVTPQSANITVATSHGPEQVLNMCANNYLGLADHPRLIETAKRAMDEHGFGMASVRFICGTQDIHMALERELATFLGTEASILFSSCFDANGGVFEALLGAEDAVISDALNHASIIDGIRLCKAKRFRYANNDMAELEARLVEARDARHRLIVTDGVFSMDGIVANLPDICDLAEKHDALVMVDDSHATGFIGPNGGGTPDHWGVRDRVHLISTTFGKALGGASGGCVAGPAPQVEMLRQRARPYLFSNALAPAIVEATREAIRMVSGGGELRARLEANAARFRSAMTAAGFRLAGEGHPIIPVMLGDAVLAQKFAAAMMERHVYVTAFSFPVVPRGQARIRTQMSAAHSEADIDRAVEAFIDVGRELEVVT
ncbi:MAG TPA: glycine C-acetyltransferase [Thermohalobaculum sp.]|nr:glycine C-acetyltransferase [Thermohalobaculum sp.]